MSLASRRYEDETGSAGSGDDSRGEGGDTGDGGLSLRLSLIPGSKSSSAAASTARSPLPSESGLPKPLDLGEESAKKKQTNQSQYIRVETRELGQMFSPSPPHVTRVKRMKMEKQMQKQEQNPLRSQHYSSPSSPTLVSSSASLSPSSAVMSSLLRLQINSVEQDQEQRQGQVRGVCTDHKDCDCIPLVDKAGATGGSTEAVDADSEIGRLSEASLTLGTPLVAQEQTTLGQGGFSFERLLEDTDQMSPKASDDIKYCYYSPSVSPRSSPRLSPKKACPIKKQKEEVIERRLTKSEGSDDDKGKNKLGDAVEKKEASLAKKSKKEGNREEENGKEREREKGQKKGKRPKLKPKHSREEKEKEEREKETKMERIKEKRFLMRLKKDKATPDDWRALPLHVSSYLYI